ncbi:MAG: hypothetical protein N2C14_24110, partial [Planctomycetales bacterium]
MKRRRLAMLAALFCCATLAWTAAAEDPLEMVLWPQGAPGLPNGEMPEILVKQDQRIGRKVTKVTKP